MPFLTYVAGKPALRVVPVCPASPYGTIGRISPVSSTSVWVAAEDDTFSSDGRIYHRASGVWSDATGSLPAQGFPYLATFSSDSNGFAVYGNYSSNTFDFWHWDGSAWTSTYSVSYLPFPNLGSSVNDPYTLDSTHTWIAVSNLDTAVLSVYFWDGSAWTSTAYSGSSTLDIFELHGTAGNLWAAGRHTASGGAGSGYVYLTQLEGTASGATLDETGGGARGIAWDVHALSSSDVWACGWRVDNVTTFGKLPAIWHYNGTAWVQVTIPMNSDITGGSTSELFAIHASGASDIWAAGYYFPNTGAQRLLLYHYNGTAWAEVALPVPTSSSGSQFNDVYAYASNDVWVSGTTCGCQYILHYDGTHWTDVSPPIGI